MSKEFNNASRRPTITLFNAIMLAGYTAGVAMLTGGTTTFLLTEMCPRPISVQRDQAMTGERVAEWGLGLTLATALPYASFRIRRRERSLGR